MLFFSFCLINLSSVFARVESSEIGLWEAYLVLGLLLCGRVSKCGG